jgi:hypothetical protein
MRRFALCLSLWLGLTHAHAQLFESHSKRLGEDKMDIVVREVERRPRVSVLDVEIRSVGSSVGSSFFILCSVRQLAQQRGNHRYVAKIEKHGKTMQMMVGFLARQDESPANLGYEFSSLTAPKDVIDLEQFAPICDAKKR